MSIFSFAEKVLPLLPGFFFSRLRVDSDKREARMPGRGKKKRETRPLTSSLKVEKSKGLKARKEKKKL